MYKIMLLERSGTTPLWTLYTETNEDGISDFKTEDITMLELKIKELMVKIPQYKIKPIQDMEFIVDILIQNGGIQS